MKIPGNSTTRLILLSPIIAAAAMSFSPVSVIANALRLNRVKLRANTTRHARKDTNETGKNTLVAQPNKTCLLRVPRDCGILSMDRTSSPYRPLSGLDSAHRPACFYTAPCTAGTVLMATTVATTSPTMTKSSGGRDMLNTKLVSWALGIFAAISFLVCVIYGLVTPQSLRMSGFLEQVLPAFE
jgi:hypothetical protein